MNEQELRHHIKVINQYINDMNRDNWDINLMELKKHWSEVQRLLNDNDSETNKQKERKD